MSSILLTYSTRPTAPLPAEHENMRHVAFCAFSSPPHAQLHHPCSPTQWHAYEGMPLCWVVSLALQHEKMCPIGHIFHVGLPSYSTPAVQYEKHIQSGMFSLLDCLCFDTMRGPLFYLHFIFFVTRQVATASLTPFSQHNEGDCLLVAIFGVSYFSTVSTVLGRWNKHIPIQDFVSVVSQTQATETPKWATLRSTIYLSHTVQSTIYI